MLANGCRTGVGITELPCSVFHWRLDKHGSSLDISFAHSLRESSVCMLAAGVFGPTEVLDILPTARDATFAGTPRQHSLCLAAVQAKKCRQAIITLTRC